MMSANDLVGRAVATVNKATKAFCKFTSANDAGSTGAHQAGYYMPKNAWSIMFDHPGLKGENKDRTIMIKWQNTFETESRFIYYGKGTRNEYRLTRFGRGFPFLSEDNVGDLFILCQISKDYYEAYVLSADDDIDSFLEAIGIGPTETNALISMQTHPDPEDVLHQLFQEILSRYDHFPETNLMAAYARKCHMQAHNISEEFLQNNPDTSILAWINTEYDLFKSFETKLYSPEISRGFGNVETLIAYSNQILNRRKSRAGKSLEHHLSSIFHANHLRFETQVITEEHKKPDFIFPDGESYHNFEFPAEELIFLGAKTTCKDRWRQILNEADRIPVKHLFTLQQGISKNQLTEMYRENVCLVVPEPYKKSFDQDFRGRILSLKQFTESVKRIQNIV